MLAKQRLAIYLIGAATAMVLAWVIGWIFLFSPVAREGREAGFSPPTYVMLDAITYRAFNRKRLTAVDLSALRIISSDKHPMIRAKVLTALFYLGGTDQATAAAEIARSKLHDAHSTVRQYALSALDHLHTLDAVTVAQGMLSDPAENVRSKAETIVKRYVSRKAH